MRLLFITRKFPPSVGGMEIYSKHLFDALQHEGADVDVFKPSKPMLRRPSLPHMAGFFLSACWYLLKRRRDYDSVLIGDFAIASLACVAKIATRGRARTVVSLHGQDLYFMRKRTLLAGIYRAIARLVVAANVLDAAIANSHAIRDEAQRRGLHHVDVVPLATSLSAAVQTDPVHPPHLLFAGRLIRYKGLSWFVEQVWPHLDGALELHVAGEVWDEAELACLEGNPRIRYLGKVDHRELPALRASAIACIMPNLPPGPEEQDEGFGLSALESPAVGTPVVAAHTGGLPDAVAEGITGFLLPPLDVPAWVRTLTAIARWNAVERQAFAGRARRHVASHYNWQLVARRTLAVLAGRPVDSVAADDTFDPACR